MAFDEVVEKARLLHSKEVERWAVIYPSPFSNEMTAESRSDKVFGRICNTDGASHPTVLSTTPGRKTVFVFGPDSIDSIILKQATYECLQSLGFDREYIYHEVVEMNAKYWLVLFTESALRHFPNCGDVIVPATWEGVLQIVSTCYPDAYKDLLSHYDELRSKSVSEFEQEAKFKFLDSKKNIAGADSSLPPFYDYNYFLTLSCPRKAWQVRLFLYCELRLLSLFRGDGFTHKENGERGPREYLCPNVSLSAMDPRHLAVLPMTVTIPP